MKKLLLLILASCMIGSCATAPSPAPGGIDSLKNFFGLCESDLEKAKKVIIERDLIKMLTHLQHMDNGGDKYYLLEREGITTMIKAVTEGIYSDFILINKEGSVIYTMKNNGIFARNVRTALGKTALNACYENRDTIPYIASVAPDPPYWDEHYIAVSAKITAPNTMPGIFILLVDIGKIQTIIGEKSFILGRDGTYQVAADRRNIRAPFADFARIDSTVPAGEHAVRRFSRSSGGTATYRLFQYSNLNWIIVNE